MAQGSSRRRLLEKSVAAVGDAAELEILLPHHVEVGAGCIAKANSPRMLLALDNDNPFLTVRTKGYKIRETKVG